MTARDSHRIWGKRKVGAQLRRHCPPSHCNDAVCSLLPPLPSSIPFPTEEPLDPHILFVSSQSSCFFHQLGVRVYHLPGMAATGAATSATSSITPVAFTIAIDAAIARLPLSSGSW